MRAIIQRVREAGCEVNGKVISHIGKGILVFIGMEKGDTAENTERLAHRCGNLRIFEDAEGKMNRSVKEVQGDVLVISQFTLCADCQKGLRPSFDKAESADKAIVLYAKFIESIRSQSLNVKEGVFGARMRISLVNDGPATFILTA